MVVKGENYEIIFREKETPSFEKLSKEDYKHGFKKMIFKTYLLGDMKEDSRDISMNKKLDLERTELDVQPIPKVDSTGKDVNLTDGLELRNGFHLIFLLSAVKMHLSGKILLLKL